jgi:hypothetical protein
MCISKLRPFFVAMMLLFPVLTGFANGINKETLNTSSNLISYASVQGQKMLTESANKKDFWALSQYFTTQENQSFCSVASLVMVLNALNVQRPFSSSFAPYRLFTQDNIFTAKVVKVFRPDTISGKGLTLKQLAALAHYFPLTVEYHYASTDYTNEAYLRFKQRAIQAVNSGNTYIIVNFNRQYIGEMGGGHFSPLAAYDAKSDRFLLMDVARYRYPPVWVTSKALWHAMSDVDGSNKKPRGYIMLTSNENNKQNDA